jgi:hypothetical protein
VTSPGLPPASPLGEPRRPPGRYDEERPPNRWLVMAAATAFAVGVSYGAVRLYQDFGGSVSTQTQRMVISDDSVLLEFDVVKDEKRAAECYLRAQDIRRELIGERTIVVPAGKRRTRVTEVLPTTRRANVGEVLRCRLLPQESTPR